MNQWNLIAAKIITSLKARNTPYNSVEYYQEYSTLFLFGMICFAWPAQLFCFRAHLLFCVVSSDLFGSHVSLWNDPGVRQQWLAKLKWLFIELYYHSHSMPIHSIYLLHEYRHPTSPGFWEIAILLSKTHKNHVFCSYKCRFMLPIVQPNNNLDKFMLGQDHLKQKSWSRSKVTLAKNCHYVIKLGENQVLWF